MRGYPLRRLRARGILPGVVLHLVRKKIRPASWRDPSALCAYYPHTDRLVVIHHSRVQREVLRLLHDLLEEKPATRDSGSGARDSKAGGGTQD